MIDTWKKNKPCKWCSHVPLAILGNRTLIFSRTLGMLALCHFYTISLTLNTYIVTWKPFPTIEPTSENTKKTSLVLIYYSFTRSDYTSDLASILLSILFYWTHFSRIYIVFYKYKYKNINILSNKGFSKTFSY